MKPEKSESAVLEIGIEGECPFCAHNPPFNAVTMAAIEESRAIMRGDKPAKWYHSVEEAREDLDL
ncbi:MAG: hypothetical protein FWC45_03685 [Treponema sp.]|nr:hypothetical protein [Treponema sp.]